MRANGLDVFVDDELDFSGEALFSSERFLLLPLWPMFGVLLPEPFLVSAEQKDKKS